MKIKYPITLLTIGTLAFGSIRPAHAQRNWVKECDENGKNCHVDNEILIRLRPQSLYLSVINDPGVLSGRLDGFLEPHALDSLSTAAGFDMSAVTVYKIAPQLGSEDVTTVDNTGETVKMDELWSIFLLVLPFGTNEQETCNKLQELYPLVRYAHLNWTTQLSGPANDASYAINQASLHATPTIPNASINVEGAWERTVGKNTIKVGVADTGIRADHADFQFNGTSVVVAGYDAIPSNPVNPLTDTDGHGTLVDYRGRAE